MSHICPSKQKLEGSFIKRWKRRIRATAREESCHCIFTSQPKIEADTFQGSTQYTNTTQPRQSMQQSVTSFHTRWNWDCDMDDLFNHVRITNADITPGICSCPAAETHRKHCSHLAGMQAPPQSIQTTSYTTRIDVNSDLESGTGKILSQILQLRPT